MRTTANNAVLEAGSCCNDTDDPAELIHNGWVCEASSCPLHIPIPPRVMNQIRRRLKKLPKTGRPLYRIYIN